jgi:hypothetical protein
VTGGTTYRCRPPPHEPRLNTAGAKRSGALGISPPRLPRALQALAHEAALTEDGPHPTVRVAPRAGLGIRLHLDGRATSVPFTAVLNGPHRTTTDNHGQPPSSLDLRRSPSSQVTAAPELALGAGVTVRLTPRPGPATTPHPHQVNQSQRSGHGDPIVLSVQLGHTYRNGCSFNRCARLVGGGSSWDRSAP